MAWYEKNTTALSERFEHGILAGFSSELDAATRFRGLHRSRQGTRR